MKVVLKGWCRTMLCCLFGALSRVFSVKVLFGSTRTCLRVWPLILADEISETFGLRLGLSGLLALLWVILMPWELLPSYRLIAMSAAGLFGGLVRVVNRPNGVVIEQLLR